MIKLWSTAEVHPRDRLAYWADAVCGAFLRLDCSPRRDPRFFGEICADNAGDVRVCTIASAAQAITRSRRQIARDPTDLFAVTVQLSGRCILSQDGRVAILKSGDVVLNDGNRPFQLSYDGDFRQTVLMVPRKALLCRLGRPDSYTATRINGAAGIGGVLSPMLRTLPSHMAEIREAARERIAENVLDLIATALLANSDGAPFSPQMTLVRAKLWIETHLSEALTAECIAARCRVSLRHINRLFEREGTSLMHHVWQRRLVRCERDLKDPAMRRRSISDIAFAWGFNDLSHFSRAYLARYGCAPSEARHAAEAMQGKSPSTDAEP